MSSYKGISLARRIPNLTLIKVILITPIMDILFTPIKDTLISDYILKDILITPITDILISDYNNQGHSDYANQGQSGYTKTDAKKGFLSIKLCIFYLCRSSVGLLL